MELINWVKRQYLKRSVMFNMLGVFIFVLVLFVSCGEDVRHAAGVPS